MTEYSQQRMDRDKKRKVVQVMKSAFQKLRKSSYSSLYEGKFTSVEAGMFSMNDFQTKAIFLLLDEIMTAVDILESIDKNLRNGSSDTNMYLQNMSGFDGKVQQEFMVKDESI